MPTQQQEATSKLKLEQPKIVHTPDLGPSSIYYILTFNTPIEGDQPSLVILLKI